MVNLGEKSESLPAKTEALVDDVFVRHHVEELIKSVEREKEKKGFFSVFFTHPLLAIAIPTFPLVISGMTLFNDSKTRLFNEVTEQKSSYDQNISSLSKELRSRNERGAMLRFALQGGLGTCGDTGPNYKPACERQIQELIYERKKNYDAAYLSWNTNYPDYLFNIGQIFNIEKKATREQSGPYLHLKSIVFNFTKSSLRRMDTCLSHLYREYQRNGHLPVDDSKQADCAGFEADKAAMRNCGVVLAEQLHAIVTVVFNKLQPSPQYRPEATSTINRATVPINLQTGALPSSRLSEHNDVLGLISSACQPQPTSGVMANATIQP